MWTVKDYQGQMSKIEKYEFIERYEQEYRRDRLTFKCNGIVSIPSREWCRPAKCISTDWAADTPRYSPKTIKFFRLVIFACEASMRIITFLCDTETHPVQLAMPTRIAETRNTTNGDRFSILCIQYFSQLFQYLFHFTLLRQDNINIRTWNLEYALKRRASHIYSSIERVENTQIQSQLVTTKKYSLLRTTDSRTHLCTANDKPSTHTRAQTVLARLMTCVNS